MPHFLICICEDLFYSGEGSYHSVNQQWSIHGDIFSSGCVVKHICKLNIVYSYFSEIILLMFTVLIHWPEVSFSITEHCSNFTEFCDSYYQWLLRSLAIKLQMA